jgi:hemoglobin-like flavoprotein
MPLSQLHKHLVRRTFMQLVAHEEQATRLFYQRLKELNPALLPIFKDETAAQPHRTIEMLALVISLFDDPGALSIQLRAIRVQQQKYHVSDEQMRQAGDALLWVIEHRLGYAFTGDIQKAWLGFYRFVGHLAEESR